MCISHSASYAGCDSRYYSTYQVPPLCNHTVHPDLEATSCCSLVLVLLISTVKQLTVATKKLDTVSTYLKAIRGKPRHPKLRITIKWNDRPTASRLCITTYAN